MTVAQVSASLACKVAREPAPVAGRVERFIGAFAGPATTGPQRRTDCGRAPLRIHEDKREHPFRHLENLNREYDMQFDLALSRAVTFMSCMNTTQLECKASFRYEDLPLRRHFFGKTG